METGGNMRQCLATSTGLIYRCCNVKSYETIIEIVYNPPKKNKLVLDEGLSSAQLDPLTRVRKGERGWDSCSATGQNVILSYLSNVQQARFTLLNVYNYFPFFLLCSGQKSF